MVSADDWPICDSYWDTSASIFTLNTFGWLTEFSTGKRILGSPIVETDPLHTKNHMVDTLQTNGYTVNIIDTSSWTQALLEYYDVVFIEVGPIDDTLLIDYVNGGVGVFLIGGHFGSELLFNEFLLHFGMSWHEVVDLRVTLTSFEPHPVTTGVSSLEIGGPTPVEVHTSDPLVLSTCDGWNLLVIYSKELVSPNSGDTWRPRAPMPTPRADLAAVAVNERIYAIGGYNGIHTLATMEEYDLTTDTWRSRAPMPTARGWLAATVVEGKIYALGGYDGTQYLPTVEEYDPMTDTWRPRADMPTHRYGLAVMAVGGRTYAIGGQNEIGVGYQTTVEEYDPATDTWRRRADMPTPRYGLAAAMVRGRIYALGGFNAIDGALATVEEYNPILNTWHQVADMPTARISLATGAVGGRLYAIGGLETYPSPVEEYDPLTDTWESRTPLPTPRAGLAAAVVRGRLYAIGGFDGDRRLGTVEEYDPPFYDTDGDGFADDDELRYGRDPLVPELEPMPPELSIPTVTVVSPNGGESWQDLQTITWTATDPQADPLTYIVYYSRDGGQTWTQLATELIESSYLWNTATVMNGVNYLIKVMASDGSHTGMDVSDTSFEITNAPTNTAPTVLVIRPNGGERIRGTFEIQWSANDPDGDTLTFTISYSTNTGQTWTQLTSGVTGTSYQWDTSGVQVGENYLIKVEASDGSLTIEDRSDAPFTVEREAPTETRSEAIFVPSFKVVEVLGALLVLLGLGKRQRGRKVLLEEQ